MPIHHFILLHFNFLGCSSWGLCTHDPPAISQHPPRHYACKLCALSSATRANHAMRSCFSPPQLPQPLLPVPAFVAIMASWTPPSALPFIPPFLLLVFSLQLTRRLPPTSRYFAELVLGLFTPPPKLMMFFTTRSRSAKPRHLSCPPHSSRSPHRAIAQKRPPFFATTWAAPWPQSSTSPEGEVIYIQYGLVPKRPPNLGCMLTCGLNYKDSD